MTTISAPHHRSHRLALRRHVAPLVIATSKWLTQTLHHDGYNPTLTEQTLRRVDHVRSIDR